MKKALIFGGSGQAGYYLTELLKSKGYGSLTTPPREVVDFTHSSFGFQARSLIEGVQPDEIYNLASLLFVPDSWKDPVRYMQVNGSAVLELLDIVNEVCPKARFFQAGSAEVFCKATQRQNEDTAMVPNSPYGLAKLFAHGAVRVYRQTKGLFACTGIFFNMESPRRPDRFFSSKVVKEAVRIKEQFESMGQFKPMQLGRLSARRDWGWTPEYVEAAWRMLQQEKPNDFVIGTGETHSCKEFVVEALKAVGLPDVEEQFDRYVLYDKEVPSAVDCLNAAAVKARMWLHWEAQYKMADVVRMLVEAEL